MNAIPACRTSSTSAGTQGRDSAEVRQVMYTRNRGPRFYLRGNSLRAGRSPGLGPSHPIGKEFSTTTFLIEPSAYVRDNRLITATWIAALEALVMYADAHWRRTRDELAMLAALGFDLTLRADASYWEHTAFELWHFQRIASATIKFPDPDGMEPMRTVSPPWLCGGSPVNELDRGMPWQFKWTSLVRKYLAMRDRVAQEHIAREIIYTQDSWVRDCGQELLALAWTCVEEAVKRDKDDSHMVCRLAKDIFGALKERESIVCARAFAALLQRCVWEEFEARCEVVR